MLKPGDVCHYVGISSNERIAPGDVCLVETYTGESEPQHRFCTITVLRTGYCYPVVGRRTRAFEPITDGDNNA